MAKFLRGWTITGQLTAGSGLPFTPVYLVPVPGTAVLGSIRASVTGAAAEASDGYYLNPAAYAAAKAGVIGLTKSVAFEVAPHGVLVNAITPGAIWTANWSTLSDLQRDEVISRHPIGRFGQAEEVAALVAWLASDECSFSTGAVFDISGGRAGH